MKELYELKGDGKSIRGIARELGVSRNSVRKYLRRLQGQGRDLAQPPAPEKVSALLFDERPDKQRSRYY